MFTDIAGYTESMSKSESKSLDTLEKKRSVLKPLLDDYKGTFVKEIGDGTLSYFESAVNAATCAVKLQESTYDDSEMNIRVGIHIGDIVFKDGDVFGGGVNVASRLESIAPAGGVCVSKSVFDELSNQDDFDGIELGLQSLKGVGRLIEVFGLKGDKLNEPKPSEYQDNKVAVHSDDEVPSIAIIPFENKGKDEDVFYAYGISADLISDVTSAGLIRVASKKQIEDAGELPIDELAKILDVRYMANGELWRMGDMFQLSVELYDTKDKKVVWSDRWQQNWDNLSTIKGDLSDGLLKALNTKSNIKYTLNNTDTLAYEYFLKARFKLDKRKSIEEIEIARGLFRKSIELDTNLLLAKIGLGWSYGETGEFDKAREIFEETLKEAEHPDFERERATVLNSLGGLCNNIAEYNNALIYYERAITIRKKLGLETAVQHSKNNIGLVYWCLGDYDKALAIIESAHNYFTKLGNDRLMDLNFNLGGLYFAKGLYQKAFKNFTISLEIRKDKGEDIELFYPLMGLGMVYFAKREFNNALNYLQEAYDIADRTIMRRWGDTLEVSILLVLTKKELGLNYDDIDINSLLDEPHTSIYSNNYNYRIYGLLGDTSYLKTAYNQVQEKADNLEPDVAAKFLSYPIPKAIVEEWEKVK
jgi:tetratricopeptide (TPR) repeat protein